MKHVRLVLDAAGREADIHPMYDLLANAPFVERAETTHMNVLGDELGIMHYVEGDAPSYIEAVEAIDDVHDYELTGVTEDSFYVYQTCETDGYSRELFDAFEQSRLVRTEPTQFTADGTVSVAVVGTAAEIQAAIERIPELVSVDIVEISSFERSSVTARNRLSDRQQEAIATALESGYYAIPREATHEDVAEAIGCAPSTAAEHLRKAEAALVEATIGE